MERKKNHQRFASRKLCKLVIIGPPPPVYGGELLIRIFCLFPDYLQEIAFQHHAAGQFKVVRHAREVISGG